MQYESFKFVGVHLDENLNSVKSKASSAVFALSSVKNILPTFFYILLQKRAIRLIDNSKVTSHSDPLFLKYKILKIDDLSLKLKNAQI